MQSDYLSGSYYVAIQNVDGGLEVQQRLQEFEDRFAGTFDLTYLTVDAMNINMGSSEISIVPGSVTNEVLYTFQAQGLGKFENDLRIGENLIVEENMDVSSNALIRQDITCGRDLFVIRDASFNNDVDISNQLIVFGDISALSNFEVVGNSLFHRDVSMMESIYIHEDASFNRNVDISNQLNTFGKVDAYMDVSFHQDFELDGSLNVHGNANYDRNVDISGQLKVLDDVQFEDVLTVQGNSTFISNVEISGTLIVDDDVSFNKNFYVKETSLFEGDVSCESNIEISNNALVNNRLDVHGDVSLNSILEVSEISLFQDTINAQKNVIITETLTGHGDVSFSSDLYVLDNLDVSNAVYFHESLYVDNSVNLYNTLDVSDTTHLHHTLVVDHSANFLDQVTAEADVSFLKNFDVYGHTGAYDTIHAYENVIVDKGLTSILDASFQKDVYIWGELDVSDSAHFKHDVFVDNSVNLYNTLDVSDATHLHHTLIVDHSANFLAQLTAEADVSFLTNFEVSGNSTFQRPVQANDIVTIEGTLTANNDVSLNKNVKIKENLDVEQTTHLLNDLFVDASATFNNIIQANNDASFNKNIEVFGTSTFQGPLHTHNNVDFHQGLTSKTDASFETNIHVFKDLNVTKNANIQGNTDLSGVLSVYRDTTLRNNLFVLQNSELYGTLDISDTAHFKNNIVVDTSAHILSTLEVDDTSTFNKSVFCKDLVKFENGVDVSGTALYRNQLTTKNHVQSDSTLTIEGTTTSNGELVTNGGTRFESLTVANADVSFNNHTKLNTLVVSNQSEFNGTTNLKGSTTIVDNAEIKDLTITGETSFDGSGAIQVGQDVHINSSKLKINNNVYLNNRDTQLDNNTDFDIVVDSMYVRLIETGQVRSNDQSTTLFDNIDVSGIATFNGQTVFNEQVSFSDLSMNIGDILGDGDPTAITTDFNVFAKQGSGQGFIYNGDVTIGNSRNNDADVSMDIYGNLTLHDLGTLHVTGPSVLHSAVVDNDVEIKGVTDLCGNTNVQDLIVHKTLIVEEDALYKQDISINAHLGVIDVSVNNNVDVSGHTNLKTTQINSHLTVLGNTTVNGLDVENTSVFQNNVTMDKHLDVLDVSINNNLEVSGNIESDNDLLVGRNAQINGTTDLCGNTNIHELKVDEILIVGKDSTFNGNVTINADTTITETARIHKDLIVDGSFSVSGLTTFINTKNLDVSDNIIVLNSVETSRDSGILIKRNGGPNAFIGYDEPSNGFKLGMTSYGGSQNIDTSLTIVSDLSVSKLEVGDLIALDTSVNGFLYVNDGINANEEDISNVSNVFFKNTSGLNTYTGAIRNTETSMTHETSSGNYLFKDGTTDKPLLHINKGGTMILQRNSDSNAYDSSDNETILANPTLLLNAETSGNVDRTINGITMMSKRPHSYNDMITTFINFANYDDHNGVAEEQYHYYGTIAGIGDSSGTENLGRLAFLSYEDGSLNNSATGYTETLTVHNNGNVGIGNVKTPGSRLDVNGDVHFTGTLLADSDRNIKTNIIRLDNCLDKVERMCGYSYTRLDLEDKAKRHVGVIAQEVEEIYPELVQENKESNKKSVNYSGLVPVLLECVKTLKNENADLRNRLEKMEQFMAKQFGM